MRGGLPPEIALANTRTHDCTFTDGYWLGYVTAQQEARRDCACYVPDLLLEDIVRLVREHGGSVVVGDCHTNEYHVVFWEIIVLAPAPEATHV